MHTPTCSPFRVLPSSIYGRSATFRPDESSENEEFLNGLTCQDEIECWLFGDYTQATEFRNCVISMIFEQEAELDTIFVNWNRIPPDARLRPFLVSLLCRGFGNCNQVKIDEVMKRLPHNLLLEFPRRIISELIRASLPF
ncbi:hypothetical protein M434DRAFT_32559 [Hypoxylon sp. CO27-5]|nr:hypothetical protein M434DRAFT_32559 [Hypoxylon sp. CO27-5]